MEFFDLFSKVTESGALIVCLFILWRVLVGIERVVMALIELVKILAASEDKLELIKEQEKLEILRMNHNQKSAG